MLKNFMCTKYKIIANRLFQLLLLFSYLLLVIKLGQ
jgi:hypothetical protein